MDRLRKTNLQDIAVKRLYYKKLNHHREGAT